MVFSLSWYTTLRSQKYSVMFLVPSFIAKAIEAMRSMNKVGGVAVFLPMVGF